jgi:signal transduction histidine kinase
VRNDGGGIAPEQKEKLFRKFSRLGGPPGDNAQKGTGLGLFIVKQIVEAHGGTVSVESDPGHWAEFRFSLPEYPHQNNHGLH